MTHRERAEVSYRTGRQIVEMVRADRRPSTIMTREAFHNAIAVNSALGGSSNAPIHLNAVARHAGVELTLDDWEQVGMDIPLLLNMQPGGDYLGEDFHRAGGVPAVMAELAAGGHLHTDAITVTGGTIADNIARAASTDHDVIRKWAEDRGGTPATAPGTEHGGHLGVLEFDFPGYGGENLSHVSWEDWFDTFDRRGLEFVYQEHLRSGNPSNFFQVRQRS